MAWLALGAPVAQMDAGLSSTVEVFGARPGDTYQPDTTAAGDTSPWVENPTLDAPSRMFKLRVVGQ